MARHHAQAYPRHLGVGREVETLMGLLRAMFLFTALASVGYAVGLLVPDLYPAPEVGPVGVAWSRYLVPIYLGLAVIGWLAYRRAEGREAIAWAFVLIWGGLALRHLLNMGLGDESVELTTVGLLLFDSMVCGLFVIAIFRDRRARVISA
jgi:hypothetical protein